MRQVRMTDEMYEALVEAATEKGVSFAAYVREAALKEAGRKDLIGTMPKQGQPKK